jgi:predicted phage-related endonuclease
MIKEFHFPLYSKAWHAWRKDHIGGSDISAVCAGYNAQLAEVSWTPPLKYYLEMIGEPVQPFMGNVSSNMGQLLEPMVRNMYRYYDRSIPPEPDNEIPQMVMFENMRNKNRINRIIGRPNYCLNTKYPYMSGSPDGFIYEKDQRGIMEIKCMTSMEMNRYANRVNPGHMLQCQHNMLCSGAPFCDLVRFIDGKWLDVIRFKKDTDIQQFIIQCAADFWNKVSQARKVKHDNDIIAYYDMNPDMFTEKQQKAVGELQAMEPDFIGTDVELKWLKEYIKPAQDETEREAMGQEYHLLEEYAGHKKKIKAIEKDVNKVQAELITFMKGYQQINTDYGHYTYKPTKAGYNKFYVQPKLLDALIQNKENGII